jgi:transposase
MLYEQDLNARVLLRFMKRLIKDAGRKVYLILDNLRVHHAKLVKAWLQKHQSAIEVFYLPAYSPDLNPDKYLNNDLKNGARTSSPAQDSSDLKKKVLGHMRLVQQLSPRVAGLFRHPSVKYAA